MENKDLVHQENNTFSCELFKCGYIIYTDTFNVKDFIDCNTWDEVLEKLESLLDYKDMQEFIVDDIILEPAKGFKEAWEQLKKEQND